MVTYANFGIDEAAARNPAPFGFHVVAVARHGDRNTALLDGIGRTVIVMKITNYGAVEALLRSSNRVDVLVNNPSGAWGLKFVANDDLLKH
uniref:B2168_F1_48 n=1 Tax=Mycobacterium leprae TaxID=1769 RepID=Q49824_MYCLR|nr:B2168_F1_48 [Mycobacterium leprae]